MPKAQGRFPKKPPAIELVRKPARNVTQQMLAELATLQAATAQAQVRQTELALQIERDLENGGAVEDGPLYFDTRLMLARSRNLKAVGKE